MKRIALIVALTSVVVLGVLLVVVPALTSALVDDDPVQRVRTVREPE
jgi:hypothetical protein